VIIVTNAFNQNNGDFRADYDAAWRAAGMYIYDTNTLKWIKQNR
jgi:hypothetical protein